MTTPFVHKTYSPYLHGTLAEMLISGRETDTCILPGDDRATSLKTVREGLHRGWGLTPAQFGKLPRSKQDKITQKIRAAIRRGDKKQTDEWLTDNGIRARQANERNTLHESLRSWAGGVLTLERPGGSSYHHLLDYDTGCVPMGKDGPSMEKINELFGEPQCLVVETDWAKTVSAWMLDGEVRMPFPHCVWEFKISGVRVLVFTRVDDHAWTRMFCVYGRDGLWVADDYSYLLRGDSARLPAGTAHSLDNRLNFEFRRVAELVLANIRAACVLLDAERVVHVETVRAPAALVSARVRAKRVPPRDYSVVRLRRDPDRQRRHRVRVAGSETTARSPQRGHWRRGTWVHYDDQDSGEVQYANDGGFIVSKTWRRWHFAGDPDNIIQREYRL